MKIVYPDLEWAGELESLYACNIKHIILHHTAHPTWNVYETHNFHKKTRGWIGIGYNWFVDIDGTIYEGRGFNKGAGAGGGYNSNSYHICFAGNFENQFPTKEQIKSGKLIVGYLKSICPLDTDILGHKEVNSTACPR